MTRGAGRNGQVAEPSPERPPGSRTELVFLDLCTRCGDCIAICPERVLVWGIDGFPEINPARGACTTCGLCADVCSHGAIDPT